MRKFHEGKVCDAVVHFLEHRQQAARENLSFPDRNRDVDPVEVAFTLDGQLFALEHTGIEPFDRQIELSEITGKFLEPIQMALEKIVPEGECYALAVPPDAPDGLNPREVGPLQQRIVDWVKATAPQRTLLASNRVDTEYGTLRVADIPFPVILTRRLSLSASAKKFQLSYFRTNDEDARLARIMKGYQKKLPKLMAWKDKSAARTVLVLESIDIQLTNHIAVKEAVLKIVAASGRRPDEIFLVGFDNAGLACVPQVRLALSVRFLIGIERLAAPKAEESANAAFSSGR